MVSVVAMDHIVLIASDLEVTLAWYMRHVGLTPVNVREWRDGRAAFPSLRVDADTIIDFVEGEHGAGRGHLDHICFVVEPDDIDSILTDGELEILDQGDRSGARGIGRSVYVRDPDGLLVEFRSYPAA